METTYSLSSFTDYGSVSEIKTTKTIVNYDEWLELTRRREQLIKDLYNTNKELDTLQTLPVLLSVKLLASVINELFPRDLSKIILFYYYDLYTEAFKQVDPVMDTSKEFFYSPDLNLIHPKNYTTIPWNFVKNIASIQGTAPEYYHLRNTLNSLHSKILDDEQLNDSALTSAKEVIQCFDKDDDDEQDYGQKFYLLIQTDTYKVEHVTACVCGSCNSKFDAIEGTFILKLPETNIVENEITRILFDIFI